MRALPLAFVSIAFLLACSSGSNIKDLPDEDVSKKSAQWTDPGAIPDMPRDSGLHTNMDAGLDASGSGPDASAPDASTALDSGAQDASPTEAGMDSGAADAN